MILKSIIPSNVWAAIQNYVSTVAAAILPSQTGNNGKYLSTNGTSVVWANAGLYVDVLNTATGSTNVTIDGNSGRCVFTDSVPDGGVLDCRLTNQFITTLSTPIYLSLKYSESGSGYPFLLSSTVNSSGHGYTRILIGNMSGSGATDSDIIVDFIVSGS